MTLQSSTLRPGLLVSLKTTIDGNVSYDKRTIEAEHVDATGAAKATWETERTIADPAEHEAAQVARSKASSLVRAICARSAFGLLCPEAREADLDEAIQAARRVADAFNAGAKLSRVSVYVITGRIAPDDVEAVRAINSEIRGLLDEMESGVRRLDVEAVRDAASRAKNVGAMLAPESAARVAAAVEAARSVARRIVKAGEAAAQEIDAASLRAITDARTAFLDLEGAGNEIAAPASEGRAIDLAPVSLAMSAAPASPMLDFG